MQDSEIHSTSKPHSSEMQINSNIGESPKSSPTGNGYDVISSKVPNLSWDHGTTHEDPDIVKMNSPKIICERGNLEWIDRVRFIELPWGSK